MSRPRFLVNHDFNDHILRGVRRLEPTIEFIRLREVSLDEADDSIVLAYAAAHAMIVVSHDVTTMSVKAWARVGAGEPMPGLFLVRQQSPIAPIIESLIMISMASAAEEWVNQVRYLPF